MISRFFTILFITGLFFIGSTHLAQAATPQVAAGTQHTVALDTNGDVWTWGLNNFGQLGDGSTTSNATPVKISGLTNVIKIAAGGYTYRSG